MNATWGEVVFNEVMADPNPPVLFAEEYLELYNRSEKELDLEDWVLQVNTRSYILSEARMPEGTILAPGDLGVVLDLTLPNAGATLSLFDPGGHLVHAAQYAIPWKGTEWKKEGGWSLESPDPEQVCNISGLWEYSRDPEGGTPGRPNSCLTVLEDREGPVLLYSGFDDAAGILKCFFSEPVLISPAALQEIVLHPGGLHPLEAHLLTPLSMVLELRFPVDLQDRPHFKVSIPDVSDCQGNECLSPEAVAGTRSNPAPESVQFNELMYDPADGYPEYIELHLPGSRYYDLREMAIHVVKEGEPANDPLPLSDHSRLMVPGSYLVVTACVEQLREVYGLPLSGQWVEAEGMKTLDNTGGTLYLTDRAGMVLDRMDYGDRMHAEILTDTRGISLERISGERSGSDVDNWHSAAAIEGYATPGRINSQAISEEETEQVFQIFPGVFSPDNDGYEDLLEMRVSTGEPGWVLSLWITDLQGNLLKKLANNHLVGAQSLYTWDGEYEKGGMVPPGFCVVHATAFHPHTGGRWIRKRAVGLVYR